jgi:hypothetical protein
MCALGRALFEVNGGYRIKGKTVEERNAYHIMTLGLKTIFNTYNVLAYFQ